MFHHSTFMCEQVPAPLEYFTLTVNSVFIWSVAILAISPYSISRTNLALINTQEKINSAEKDGMS